MPVPPFASSLRFPAQRVRSKFLSMSSTLKWACMKTSIGTGASTCCGHCGHRPPPPSLGTGGVASGMQGASEADEVFFFFVRHQFLSSSLNNELAIAPRTITSCSQAESTRVTVQSLSRFVSGVHGLGTLAWLLRFLGGFYLKSFRVLCWVLAGFFLEKATLRFLAEQPDLRVSSRIRRATLSAACSKAGPWQCYGAPGNLQQNFLRCLDQSMVQHLVDLKKAIKHLKETADIGIVFRPILPAEVASGNVADRSLPEKSEVRSRGGYLVFLTTQGLATGQSSPIHLMAGRSGNIKRVCAGSHSAEAYSVTGSGAACESVQHAHLEMTDKF